MCKAAGSAANSGKSNMDKRAGDGDFEGCDKRMLYGLAKKDEYARRRGYYKRGEGT